MQIVAGMKAHTHNLHMVQQMLTENDKIMHRRTSYVQNLTL